MLGLPQESREALRKRFAGATINFASFTQHYAWCELAECQGICCRSGVWLEPEEYAYLKENENHLREKLPAFGVEMPTDRALFDEGSMGRFTVGTNVKPFDYSGRKDAAGLEPTACVFRRGDGACGLQLLGVAEGKPSWFYKPLYCFLFPVDINEREGAAPVIEITDARQNEGFAGKTMCGNPNANGRPGYEIFARELATLSEILGRDLLAEMKAGIRMNEDLLSVANLSS